MVQKEKGYSKDYIRSFSAVLQQSFRFAVSPKQYITFNPMQFIKLKYQTDEVDLFSDDILVPWTIISDTASDCKALFFKIHIMNVYDFLLNADSLELLGHSDVSTTINVYAHSTRKAKRESARLLDKVAGND